jgi:hypothetical protein
MSREIPYVRFPPGTVRYGVLEQGPVPAGLHDPLSLDVPTPAQLMAEYERLLAEGHETFTAAEAASAAGDWDRYEELCSADSRLTNRAWYYRDRAERMLVGAGDPAPWKLTVGELAAHVAEGRLMDGSQSWADVEEARADGMGLADQDRRMVEFLCDDDPALVAKVLAGQSFTVYRATNAEIGIFPGAYVTPHVDYAENHLHRALNGAGHVIAETVTSADLVIGHSANEFYFAPRNLAAWHESVVAIAVNDGRQVPEKVLAAYPELAAKAAHCGVAMVDVPSAVARAADPHSRDLLKVWDSRYPDLDPDADLDSDKGMCESCGLVDDWEALHSATPGVYCDDCAYLDAWECDCEPCAEDREMSA